jgi:hypothetical protein
MGKMKGKIRTEHFGRAEGGAVIELGLRHYYSLK